MAREKLSGKYGISMLVTPVIQFALAMACAIPLVIILMVYMVASTVGNSESNILVIAIIYLLTMIPYTILFGVLNTGISLFYLNIACGRKYSVSDMFYGFRVQFKKSLALSAVTVLASYACTFPYMVFYYLSLYDPQEIWTILMAISYIGAMIIYVPIQLSLSQCFYLLLDFPNHSTKELVKLSVQVMKGHKKRLFYIQLSFIPVQILCILSFYIGYLWAIPYMYMTNALFFLDIMKPKQDTTPYDPFTN